MAMATLIWKSLNCGKLTVSQVVYYHHCGKHDRKHSSPQTDVHGAEEQGRDFYIIISRKQKRETL